MDAKSRADVVRGRRTDERDDEARHVRPVRREPAGRLAPLEQVPSLAHHRYHVVHWLRVRHTQVLQRKSITVRLRNTLNNALAAEDTAEEKKQKKEAEKKRKANERS